MKFWLSSQEIRESVFIFLCLFQLDDMIGRALRTRVRA
jgi:hypothetical protein